MSIIKGCVFNVARFSINDGPGIRTTVFLKGCPLHCDWCHNPESILPFPQLMYRGEKCTDCGKCVNVCDKICHTIEDGIHKINIKNCISCGLCANACHENSLEICGEYMTTVQVIQEIKKDISFYNSSNGGMTISGGEPLFQPEFTKELLKLAKAENIHTCVETSGMCDQNVLTEVAKVTDLFLFDYKHSNSRQLEKYTGANYNIIYENLMLLERLNKAVVLRCPIIPGVNDTYEHLDKIIDITNTFANIIEVNILPYHSFGEQKSKSILPFRQNSSFSIPTEQEMLNWTRYLKQYISKTPIC